MKVLVTGCNGFIGRQIVKTLGEKHNIVGCDIADNGKAKTDSFVSWKLGHEECPELLIDKDIDAVVHVAACLDKNDENEELIYSNCLGTHQVYNLCRNIECKVAILISGIPIVGAPDGKPISEEDLVRPESMYLATKAAQELIISQLGKTGIRTVCIRVPAPVGPGQPETTIVPIFLRRAFENKPIVLKGKGSRRQNYIDIRDLAGVIDNILDNPDVNGIYNIGSSETVSNVEIAKKCIAVTGSSSDIVFDGEDPGDDQDWQIDCRKLKSVAGDFQHFDIDRTLQDMYEYMGDRN